MRFSFNYRENNRKGTPWSLGIPVSFHGSLRCLPYFVKTGGPPEFCKSRPARHGDQSLVSVFIHSSCTYSSRAPRSLSL